MKKILYIFLGFFFLVLLGLITYKIWWFYQSWPRRLEPELWSLDELETIPEDPAQNAWRFFEKSSDDWGDVLDDLPEELNSYAYDNYSDDSPDEFWRQAQEQRDALANYFENSQNRHAAILKNYEVLLGYSQFVDMSEPSFKKKSPRVINLLDLNRFARLYTLHLALQGEWQKNHAILLKQLKQNIAWAYSARSLLSQLASLSSLQDNVEFLRLLKSRYPAESWAEIEVLLRSIQWEQINLKKGIISEYYFQRNTVDTIDHDVQTQLDNSARTLSPLFDIRRLRGIYRIWSYRWFNPNLLKNKINQRFISYQMALQNPTSIDEHFEENLRDPSFSNLGLRFSPNDSVLELLNIKLGKSIREYYQKKEELKLKVQVLLSGTTPPQSLESQPVETKP